MLGDYCSILTFNISFIFPQKIGLQIKATLENVTELEPEGEDFRWYLKVKV